jgi:hypothetical protein
VFDSSLPNVQISHNTNNISNGVESGESSEPVAFTRPGTSFIAGEGYELVSNELKERNIDQTIKGKEY